jgi:hypothetical protein
LLGSGNGSFSAASNISIPGEPLSVAAGDLTGDGLVDLAVADYSGGNLTLLAGNGDGTFQPPVSAFTGDGASDVVIADINRDGTPDIVVTNELDGDVTAILEDGIGNYIIYRDYWLDGGTHSVAVQDLNADRKREIIAANRYGGDISILWNETPVTFRFDVFPNSVGFDTVALGSVKLDTITVANRSDTTQNIQVTLSDNPAFATIPGPQAFNPFEVRHYAVSFNPGALGNNAGHFVFTGNVTTPPETAGVHGVGSAIISLFSMYDSDGDPMTTADQAPKPWIMALYQDSVGPNTLVDSGLTAVLTTRVTAPGPYIAGEVQGGADWQRINGNRTLLDTLAILAPVVRDTFVNFQPNVLTVEFLEDNDGLLRTACDRSPDSWHADVRRDSAGGPVVAGGNGAVLDVPYLPDGNYVVTESDSSGWTPIGYAVGYSDSTPLATPGAGRTVMVSLGGGRSSSVQFINAPPVNNRLFRSFAPESLALDRDNRGKLGKFVLRKPDKDEFTFKLRPPFVSDSVISLALKFSMTVNAKISRVDVGGVQTVLDSVYGKVWSGVVHARPGYISVKGFGFKGTPVKVTYQWTMSRTGGAIRGTLPAASYSLNQPRLPMPDRVNALADCFSFGAFLPTGGLPVGYAAVDSPKAYGWLVAPKYSDVLKTLYDKGNLQDGPSSNFGDFVGGSPVVRQQKSLPPDKYNNVLLGDLIALKLNIAASAMGMTPVGFGELVFSDGSRGPLDGRMIRDIAALADSMISARSYYARFPSRDEYDTSVGYGKLDTAIAAINHAFEGPIDTLTFADSLVFRGARPLGAVLFLRANPGVTPTIIHPLASPLPLTPVKYRLYQNYPNPFNPTTTIQFDLPEPAIVTLKIYNILGQEVLSIYDHQQLDEGREEVQFDAGGFSSGVYFYRLVAVGIEKDTGPASGFSSVKKMLLIK